MKIFEVCIEKDLKRDRLGNSFFLLNQVHAARQSLRVHGYMRDSSVIHRGAHGAALDRVLLGRAAVSDDDAGALLLHNRKRGRDAIFEFWKLKKNQFSK